ncbi:MAG: cell division ATP-binding protein FtsE [Pseudomonadota bacterium]|nr:cell division ATP-binding protein FtsE [Pseudomonadota bacterium]
MIKFDQVTKRYESGNDALKNVTFEVERGELIFLTGASGAGKSTLLRLIALIERPSRGNIIVDGRNVDRMSLRNVPKHRREIGIVFQENKLLKDLSAFDNVALPLLIAGANTQEMARRVRAALDQVGLLKKERKKPIALSTGEQQRIGIARAIVIRPKLVIADEPTGNLDPWLSLEIMKLFGRFNDIGVTMVIATHAHDLIKQINGRRIHLKNGEIVEPNDEALVF